MNYLAHCFLSENSQIQFGNIIGDFVKGNKIDNYSGDIKKGILLHRKIDEFTDRNENFKRSVFRLDDKFGKYRYVITDVLYDHLLAKNWNKFSQIPLNIYCENIYLNLDNNYNLLPETFHKTFRYMKSNNILFEYKNIEMIRHYLIGISQRCKYIDNLDESLNTFNERIEEFENDFKLFMVEIMDFVQVQKKIIKA